MKHIFILILLILFIPYTNARYFDYQDDYQDEIYYEEDERDSRDYYEDENYDDRYYDNSPTVYKNGNSCTFIGDNSKLIFGCYFNGYCYQKPGNSSCVVNPYNAWACNSGYREINGSCSNHCNIKGNIGFDSKEKIYHLSNCLDYNTTTINESYGEKWFCSENEAITAGWRKSLNCPSPKVEYKSTYTSSKDKEDNSWIIWILIVIGFFYRISKN